MARVTIERITDKCENRFELAVLASYRAHAIDCGVKSVVDANNKFAVMALREIEQGKIDVKELHNIVVDKYALEMETGAVNNSFIINDYSMQNEDENTYQIENLDLEKKENTSSKETKETKEAKMDSNFFAE